jgi:peptidoglycan/xylan/chitin deacetylase (PgdA/CDA1 family)
LPRGEERADRSATRVAEEGEKVLFFTFDDGPSEYTPKVLDVLAKHDAHATFFLVGEQVREYPELVERIRAEGHTIGNHTLAHKSLPHLSSEEVRAAVEGGPQSRCLRPPYGATSSRVRKIIEEEMGLEIVMWGVDPRDWERPGVEKIQKRVLKNMWPGAIVLFHDGGGKRDQTVEAVDYLLTELGERGYKFVALDC